MSNVPSSGCLLYLPQNIVAVPSLSPGMYSMMMKGYVMGETHARFIPLFFPDVSHESVEKTHKLFYNGGSIVERVRPSDDNRMYFLSDNDRSAGVQVR